MKQPREENPWNQLAVWPSWRSVAETLTELEQVCRRAAGRGAEAIAELADTIASVLAEPSAFASGAYAVSVNLKQAAMGDDQDTDPAALLSELARHVADFASMSEALPQDAQRVVTHTVPRIWQTTLKTLLQQVRTSAARTARSESTTDKLQWGAPESAHPGRAWHPQYVVTLGGGEFAVVLPDGSDGEVLQAVHQELVISLLHDGGEAAAAGHLFLFGQAIPGGRYTVSSDEFAAAVTGRLRRPGGPPNSERDTARYLGNARVSTYEWHLQGERFSYRRRSEPLWHLTIRDCGQSHIVERSGQLVRQGAQWEATIAGGWTDMLADTASSDSLRQAAQAIHSGQVARGGALALVMAVRLLPHAAEPELSSVDLPTQELLAAAGHDALTASVRDLGRLLLDAAKRQVCRGWQPDRESMIKAVRAGNLPDFLHFDRTTATLGSSSAESSSPPRRPAKKATKAEASPDQMLFSLDELPPDA